MICTLSNKNANNIKRKKKTKHHHTKIYRKFVSAVVIMNAAADENF